MRTAATVRLGQPVRLARLSAPREVTTRQLVQPRVLFSLASACEKKKIDGHLNTLSRRSTDGRSETKCASQLLGTHFDWLEVFIALAVRQFTRQNYWPH